MKKTRTIKMPKPCHEDWEKMTPVERGRHCGVCSTVVYDFSNYTDEQLIEF